MGNTGTQDQPAQVTTTIVGAPVVEVTGTSQQANVNTKYIANNASRVTIAMPTTANVGEQVSIRGKGAGGWKLVQNANQTIHGAADSTTGTSGYIQSQTPTDTVVIECTTANTDWLIISNRGTLDIG